MVICKLQVERALDGFAVFSKGSLKDLGNILNDGAEGKALSLLSLTCAAILVVLSDLYVRDSDLKVAHLICSGSCVSSTSSIVESVRIKGQIEAEKQNFASLIMTSIKLICNSRSLLHGRTGQRGQIHES